MANTPFDQQRYTMLHEQLVDASMRLSGQHLQDGSLPELNLGAVHIDLWVDFRRRLGLNPPEQLTLFTGERPKDTCLSLVFNCHVGPYISDVWKKKLFERAFSRPGNGMYKVGESPVYPSICEPSTIRPIDVQCFIHGLGGMYTVGLIIHCGTDHPEDRHIMDVFFEDQFRVAALMNMGASWLLTPDNEMHDIQPPLGKHVDPTDPRAFVMR